jgi:ribosomal protein L40E
VEIYLNHYLFGGIMVKHVIGVVAAIILALYLFPKIFSRKSEPDVYITVQCLECGWGGRVSKYHQVCRKCNSKTLDKIG